MRYFVPMVVALVVGIVAGSWQPRGELLELREEADTLRKRAARPCRQGGAGSLSEIFRMPEEGSRSEAPSDPEPAPDAPTGPVPGDDGAPAPDPAPADPATREDTVAALKAGLDARRAQALQSLVEQAELDDEQVAEVDAVMDRMNADLKQAVDEMVQEVLANGEVDRREMMEFGADALDIVLEADDRMREILPEDVYASVDDASVDPFSYVSGDTLASAVRLEGLKGFE